MKRGRRRFTLGLTAGAALAASWRPGGGAGSQSRRAPTPRPQLGINLAGPVDWNTELPFVDVFRLSRRWSIQTEGRDRSLPQPEPALDDDGWIKSLPPGSWAETPLCGTDGVERAPPGDWTVLYDGVGEIEMWGKLDTTLRQPGRLVFRMRPGARGGFYLRLRRTHPDHPVRRVRVLMPGHAGSYQRDAWNPSLLRRWQGMAALRFMDLQKTNDSTLHRWRDRPRLEEASFARAGVAPELLADLANRLAADPWFNLPHGADDDYVRSFAELLRERLDRQRRIYLEYSNELWNRTFEQHRFAVEQGRRLGPADSDQVAAARFTAQRSREIFTIFARVFGGQSHRLVRVIATQAANPRLARELLGWQQLGLHSDALAIAPYLGLIASRRSEPSAEEVAGWSVDRLLEHLSAEAFPRMEERLRAHRELATAQGLRLVAYEGGQHLVGAGGAAAAVTGLFQAANRHPRMGELYRRMYALWERGGGDLFCHFSSVSRWGRSGSWGLLEQHDEDPHTSPKFMESMRWARARGQGVNAGPFTP